MSVNVVWPSEEERRLVTRFYLSDGLSRALYLIYPFEFAYLYLVMDRPEWAVLPLMVMSGTSLVMQLPTGMVADRWGRKASVVVGGGLTSVTYAVVPWASRLDGTTQLLAICGAFAVTGLGETLMMGAQEAWVVDNLRSAGRSDLVEPFFARTYAVDSIGGVVAGTIALILLLGVRVDRLLLDSLWYVTAAGFLLSVAVAAGIHEERPDDAQDEDEAFLRRMWEVVKTVVRARSVLYLTLAVFIANLSGAGADEAFPIALITTGIDARALGPVTVVEDLFGVAAPLLALVIVRRVGAEQLLARSLLACGAAVTVLLFWRSSAVIIMLWVALGFVDRMWDPVAMARLQEDIPSEHRAAISSLVYQANGVAELVGLGLLAGLLGSRSAQLRNATPDLVSTFTERTSTAGAVPTGLFGLPVPDVAILLLVMVSVLAVPFVFMARRARRRTPAAPAGGGTKVPVR